MFNPENIPDIKLSPKSAENVLSRFITWFPKEKRAVTLGEYIVSNLPEVADKFNLTAVGDMKFIAPWALDRESQFEFGVAFIDQNRNPGVVLSDWEHEYTDDDLIEEVKKRTKFGREYANTIVGGEAFFLGWVARGTVYIDPNEPDDTGEIKLPEFPF